MNAISSRRRSFAGSRGRGHSIRQSARNWFSLLASLTLVAGTWAALGSSPASAATTTTVVGTGDLSPNGPWALEPTSNTGTFSFVDGPNSPPGGVGSLAMNITTGQHSWLNNYSYGACATGPACTNPPANWTLLSSIDALAYSTYRTSGTTVPTYNIEVAPAGTAAAGDYATFVFVPNGPVATNMWQTWNAFGSTDGVWFSTRMLATPPFNCAPQSCSASWSQIVAAYGATARVKYGLGPNVGTGGTFTGNVDNFTIGISGTTTVYDFEPECTTTCFVNAATGDDLNTGQSGDPMKTIQAAVNRVNVGGTVNAASGTYDENVTVSKAVRITGAGTTTVVRPALSAPNPGACSGASLCAGASSVFLVKASNVTIDHLKVDGDNTTLGTGVNVGGANVDARNGIITDHTSAPCNAVCNGLSVHDVTLQNIFLRGVYASSGGTFNFTNNIVNNVQADPGSIAMFTFLGSGVMTGNHVSNANDALAANHSQGTTFTSNTVTTSLSGIHTDNAGDSGGVADTISGNNVSCTPGSGAFGVWEFVPYKAPAISSNTVSGCDVGLAALASCNLNGTNSCAAGVVPTVVFSNNNVTTTATAGALGFYVTTDTFGFGDGQVKANGDHNVINGPGKSVYVEETGTETATVAVTRNSLLSLQNTGATTVNATCNWWGQASGPGGGQVTGPATKSPFLGSSNLDGPCPAPPPGPTAPGSPTMVHAIAKNASAVVAWKAPANNGGSAVNGYVVTPVKAGVVQAAQTFNSTATTQVIVGLKNATVYKFLVAAKNAVGVGAATSTGGVRVGAPGMPARPVAKNTSPGKLKLTFKAPSPNGARITSFTATCKSGNGGATGSKTGPKSPITVSGLTTGKRYACSVKATNSRGSGPVSYTSAPTTA